MTGKTKATLGIFAAFIGWILLATFGQGSDETFAPMATVAPIDWSHYAPSVKTDIDALVKAKNCNGLLESMRLSNENSEATFNRTGVNNDALGAYIATGMIEAKCV